MLCQYTLTRWDTGVEEHEPISVSCTNSEAKGSGEVEPETFPEFSGDRSNGHLVSGGGGDGSGFARTLCQLGLSLVKFSHWGQTRTNRSALADRHRRNSHSYLTLGLH